MIAQLDRAYLRAGPARALPRLISYFLFEGRPLTTRGRWINPLVLAMLRGLRRLPVERPVVRPVFIVGTGRSGTTVLGRVLSMHRDIGFLNEPKAIWHVIHPEEDLVGSYTRGPARYVLDASDASAEARLGAERLYSAYLTSTRATRVVDKYPELVFRHAFVRALFPDCRFIWLVRSGWSTCSSIRNWSDRHAIFQSDERHDWWGRDDRKWRALVDQVVPLHEDLAGRRADIRGLEREEDRAAVEWITSARAGLELVEACPDAALRVDYESLASRPGDTLAQIADFCALAPDAPMMRYASQVLRPAPSAPRFELSSLLRDAFESTLRRLGYPA